MQLFYVLYLVLKTSTCFGRPLTSITGFIPSQLTTKPVAVTTVYSVPDDGRKGRPKHVELLTPNKEHKKVASRWHLYD